MRPLACFLLFACALLTTATERQNLFDGELKAWSFHDGREFPGASGSLSLAQALPDQARTGLQLDGDFSKGGMYVQMGRRFDGVAADELRFWLRYPDADRLTLRLVDGGKQTHQIRLRIPKSPGWQEIRLPLKRFFARMGYSDAPEMAWGYQTWGGPDDGRWRGAIQGIYFLINEQDCQSKTPRLEIADLVAIRAVSTGPRALEADISLARGWEQGQHEWSFYNVGELGAGASGLSVVKDGSEPQLRIAAHFEEDSKYVGATCPMPIPVDRVDAIRLQMRSNQVTTYSLQMKDASGQTHQRRGLKLTPDGKWQDVEWIPAEFAGGERWGGAKDGRWHAPLSAFSIIIPNYGAGDNPKPVLELRRVRAHIHRSTPLPAPEIRINSAAGGNLFQPGEALALSTTVSADYPLQAPTISWEVRGFWGNVHASGRHPLAPHTSQPGSYHAAIPIPPSAAPAGVYREFHVSIAPHGAELSSDYAGFAVLPVAPNSAHEHREIPFTIRNWDDRMPDYIRLAKRLGFSSVGLWSDWQAEPPYASQAPTLPVVQAEGIAWVGRTPGFKIEQNLDGHERYTSEALTAGARRFVETYKRSGLAYITLGNEPKGGIEQARKNATAYAAIYAGVKQADPSMPVFGTSVGPDAHFFQAGFQASQDFYDFHAYEEHDTIDGVFEKYEALFEEFGSRKPIVSTELGRNSQGLTRCLVSQEIIKKFAIFFANEGVIASWFDICYPDKAGSAIGSFGEAHNLFDSRYNLYNPKLDAITCYHVINGIGNKRFCDRRKYADGSECYLFTDTDGNSLQIVWNDEGRSDIGLAIEQGAEVRALRIDGSQSTLWSASGTIGITAQHEPVLLQYRSEAKTLPETLSEPAIRVGEIPVMTADDTTASFPIDASAAVLDRVSFVTPPAWQVALSTDGEKPRVTIWASTAASVRKGCIQIRSPDAIIDVAIPVARDGQ